MEKIKSRPVGKIVASGTLQNRKPGERRSVVVSLLKNLFHIFYILPHYSEEVTLLRPGKAGGKQCGVEAHGLEPDV